MAIASSTRNRTAGDSFGERWAVDELHHESSRAADVFDAVNRRDVRVVQRCQHVRFALESRQPVGIVHERIGQNLQRDITVQLDVAGSMDFAHSTDADARGDFI